MDDEEETLRATFIDRSKTTLQLYVPIFEKYRLIAPYQYRLAQEHLDVIRLLFNTAHNNSMWAPSYFITYNWRYEKLVALHLTAIKQLDKDDNPVSNELVISSLTNTLHDEEIRLLQI